MIVEEWKGEWGFWIHFKTKTFWSFQDSNPSRTRNSTFFRHYLNLDLWRQSVDQSIPNHLSIFHCDFDDVLQIPSNLSIAVANMRLLISFDFFCFEKVIMWKIIMNYTHLLRHWLSHRMTYISAKFSNLRFLWIQPLNRYLALD